MAYSLFINRLDPPLQLDEWLAAVDAHEAVRRATSDENAPLNPFNGEPMQLKIMDGDAEVFDDGDWSRMFSWQSERNGASFNSRSGGGRSGVLRSSFPFCRRSLIDREISPRSLNPFAIRGVYFRQNFSSSGILVNSHTGYQQSFSGYSILRFENNRRVEVSLHSGR
jgi:hypothetical protein